MIQVRFRYDHHGVGWVKNVLAGSIGISGNRLAVAAGSCSFKGEVALI